jgi:hypothetical protein
MEDNRHGAFFGLKGFTLFISKLFDISLAGHRSAV